MQVTKYLLVVLMASFAAAFAPPSVANSQAPRDLTPGEAAEAMNFVYEVKTGDAIDYLRRLEGACDGQPFYLLVKARVDRELLTIDDEDKDQIEADSGPMHRDLERVIEVCSRRIGEGNEDPTLMLYRGLAWMSKAHLSSFAREFWSAGRDAKRGKSDLEAYLEVEPEDPLALGTMGVFLYFADTIPSLFKYLSKLLLMPTGDREKGLRYMEYAADHPNLMQVEFEAVRANVYLLFEGRFEDGIERTMGLIERFPENPRIVTTLALALPFDAAGVGRNAELVDVSIDRLKAMPPDYPERYAFTLLEFLYAYASRFFAPPNVAQTSLRRIADAGPDHPDWVAGYAAFELGRLLASMGEAREAQTAFDWVNRNQHAGYLHDDSKRLMEALRELDRSANVPESTWITEIYFGSDEDRRNAIEGITASASTPSSDFYLAEATLLAGDFDAALAVYRSVVDSKVDPWNEEFQMLASSRIAEIYGARGDYENASRWLDRAMDHYQKEFLVDWMLEGRRRFYDRLRDGETDQAPRILSPLR
jgi:tetratricopeptide (TPR) repeat protein